MNSSQSTTPLPSPSSQPTSFSNSQPSQPSLQPSSLSNQVSINQPPSTSTRIPIDPWTIQTVERIHTLFGSHSSDISFQSVETVFNNLLKQYVDETKLNGNVTHKSLSTFMIMVSLWGLVRMQNTTNLEARRQYGLFINHLQDAESCLLKSVQIQQRSPAPTMNSLPVSPSQRVTSLPLST